MDRIFDGKYHYNKRFFTMERADREQHYKGVRIVSVTSYTEGDYDHKHRYYEVTYPNGDVSMWGINKRGGNITDLKAYIDFKIKYGEL